MLDGGDYFHVKSPTRNSHGLVYQSAEIHRIYPCPTYCIEGNHDIANNNLESIDRQPLGVLYASGVFRHLREEVFEGPGFRVRIVGVPYSPFRTLDEMRAIKKKEGDTYLIVVAHALAAEDPPDHVEDFFGEPVFRYQDLVSEDGPDIWCFGHWHRDQGIVRIGETSFVNQGAVSRGALVRENLERCPKVALIEAGAMGIRATPLLLDVAPASEVFDLEKKERQEKEATVIEQFTDTLKANASFDATENIEASLHSLDFAPKVRERAFSYLERARQERAR